MKKIAKIFAVMLAVLVLIPTTSFASNNIDRLNEKLKEVESFKEYEDEIKSEYVMREVESSQGTRITVSYNLEEEDGKKVLIFVADNDLNILFGGLTEQDGENAYLTDFELKTTETFSLRWQPDCYTDVCTRTRGRLSYDPAPGCSAFIGQSCNWLNIVGHPVLSAVCKGGVWVLCNVSYDRICTDSVRYDSCEY